MDKVLNHFYSGRQRHHISPTKGPLVLYCPFLVLVSDVKPVSVKYILNNSALVKFQNILLNSRRVRALSLAIMTGDAGNAFTGALTLLEKRSPTLSLFSSPNGRGEEGKHGKWRGRKGKGL